MKTAQRKTEAVEVEHKWHEEYDAWLELIEGHLESIRRLLLIMLAVMILVGILVAMLAYFIIIPMLRARVM